MKSIEVPEYTSCVEMRGLCSMILSRRMRNREKFNEKYEIQADTRNLIARETERGTQ
jgi:hypothetical protein